MIQILRTLSICFSVLAAAIAVIVLVRTYILLVRIKKQSKVQKHVNPEGGDVNG